jgi:hypothetical protein
LRCQETGASGTSIREPAGLVTMPRLAEWGGRPGRFI